MFFGEKFGVSIGRTSIGDILSQVEKYCNTEEIVKITSPNEILEKI